ncbi:MAG: hypothetical protein JXR59_02930 [Desulfuromonadaceae bacterium]|nr:hypothetical protein [Desulfuromonadaceae bacterium]
MAFFFPNHARSSDYARLYACLTPVERILVLREFIGVTYRRRFQFFQRYDYHAWYQAPFRHNLQIAVQRQEKRFRIAMRCWRKPVRTAYLQLIFRHYALGFVLQLLRKRHRDGMPLADAGCYPDAVDMLHALQWFLDHEPALQQAIDEAVDTVEREGTRSLYLYCLRAFVLVRDLLQAQGEDGAWQRLVPAFTGGRIPLGAELEFSNLGYRASFEHSCGHHRQDEVFHNFVYFHQFFLEDVSWRLGGYLDHHVRLRRYLPVPWVGGFFEYSLVRMDYQRRFSLPLTRDPGFLASYLHHVVRFNCNVAPHSLHLNCERLWRRQPHRPEFGDYLCLMVLGGELARGEDGVLREQRLSQQELIKLIRLRNHHSLLDGADHDVTEFAFLRLNAQRTVRDWTTLIAAMKGFHAVSDFQQVHEPINELALWARRPYALQEEQIRSFLARVEDGLRMEHVYGAAQIRAWLDRLSDWLMEENRRLLPPPSEH